MSSGLSNRIRKIRESRNETMEEFGLNNFNPPASKGVVSNWENGYNKPNKQRLDIIASLGGITTDELLHGTLADDVKRYEVFSKFFNEDVGKYLTFMIEQLDSGNPNLLFESEELDEENQKLLKESLQTNYNIIKKLNS